ncbi:hypothetical protein L8T67_07485 [Campylobacter lari]|uniref:hypothetical protein n=1 Tax=Campylobacter peloridis TaxID=488546 RepID=UPI001C72D008|nr:hypothetical protein [Campylobacter peloridis]MBX2077925.1 hypothetical protein [Campylobacter peloridis]MCV3385209.1 hypothetical protein [Campylobacter lari]
MEKIIKKLSKETLKKANWFYENLLKMSPFQLQSLPAINLKILENIAIKRLKRNWNKLDYIKLDLIQTHLIALNSLATLNTIEKELHYQR